MNAIASFRNVRNTRKWSVLLACQACGLGSVAHITALNADDDPAKYGSDIAAAGGHRYSIDGFFPEIKASIAPESVPEPAADAYIEGCDNLRDGRYTSAIAMFRRAMEMGLKQFTPEIEAWKLEKRIDKLAAAGAITQELKSWAHKIRLEGNDAIHEVPKPSREEAEELRLFTELLLMYLFTLPTRVRANLPAADPAAA